MDFKVDSKELEKKFEKAQKIIDSEVLRRCDPLIPLDTGMLKKSGITNTVIGSGIVTYATPYARKQYYENAGRGRQGISKKNTHNYKCLRGSYWFERMKASDLEDIKKKVAEVFKND